VERLDADRRGLGDGGTRRHEGLGEEADVRLGDVVPVRRGRIRQGEVVLRVGGDQRCLGAGAKSDGENEKQGEGGGAHGCSRWVRRAEAESGGRIDRGVCPTPARVRWLPPSPLRHLTACCSWWRRVASP